MNDPRSADTARHTITPHLVVRDAGAASQWYQRALGAEERGRIPVPGGRFMQIELRFGDSTVMIAAEFPELGVVSPLSVGGTAGALAIHTDDVEVPWRRALEAGAKASVPVQERNVMAGFGMVGKLVARPGRRGELVDLLMDATRELQGADGCELYVVSQDRDDLDTIWVFEAWRDEAAHRASLAMPAVRGVIERGLPLIAERDGAKLEPVGGVGLTRS